MDIGQPIKRYTVIPVRNPIVAPEPIQPALPERRKQPALPALEPAEIEK